MSVSVIRRFQGGAAVMASPDSSCELSLVTVDSPSSIANRMAPMLDNPDKTAPLLAALMAAVPFEVELTPELIEYLRQENLAAATRVLQNVSAVSYAGDEGGIMCHIVQLEEDRALVVSLTHVHVPRSMPLARAIANYQKHRVKKLKKQRDV
jgi:hypothetical protein